MLTKLAPILIFALVVTNGAAENSTNLPAQPAIPPRPELKAPPPSKVCNKIINVMNGDEVEKVMCYVKQQLTGYQAKKSCENRGMQLYQPNDNARSWAALREFGRTILRRNPNIEVYVGSRGNRKSRCQAFNGNGKLEHISCAIPSHSLCEYFVYTERIQCLEYTGKEGGSYVNTTDIAEPQECIYKAPIPYENTIISTNGTIAKENIVELDMSFTSTVEHVPLDLAENFPNLQVLSFWNCRIKKLSYRSLKGLSRVQYVDFEDNLISVVETATFKDMLAMETIYFDGNPLTTISGNFALYFPAMEDLNIGDAGCMDDDIEYDGDELVWPVAGTHNCTIT